jgi:hypothetical protein
MEKGNWKMNKKALIFFLIGVSTAFCLGWVFHDPDVIIIDKPVIETVKIPYIVTETLVQLETVEVPYPVYMNNTVVHYVPTPMPLMDFQSESMLFSWIESDNTDSLEYDSRWTCMDFTLRTIRNAEIEGYRIYFVYERDPAHALCMAYVVDEAKYIVWEPQSDLVEWEWFSNAGG